MRIARTILAISTTVAAAAAAPSHAAERVVSLDIRAGPLSAGLHALARQSGTELLFREEALRGHSAAPVRGRFTVNGALRRLLRGTDLSVRPSPSGAYIIERRPPAARALKAVAETGTAPEPPVPEILVIGRRTQNADIRRRENDVQPYQVSTGRQIVQAHRDTLDEYFRSRITSNTQVLPASLVDEGEAVSEIDLRGLGADGTLVLVDGRRLPSIPDWRRFTLAPDPTGFGFRQPDLNAIPLHAIERVETLTGTAGGIYGFGALGGVVNVVLKRDYRGAELHGTTGITSRGDAERVALEGRIGFTPDGGRTDVMLYLSHAMFEPLLVGDRDYAERDLELSARFSPEWFAILGPPGNAVSVEPFLGDTLTFRPEHGGGSLGAAYTFLPAGFSGTPAEMVQALRERAGRRDFSLSEGQAATGIGSTPTLSTAIANARHRFSDRIEGFVDGLAMRNRGSHVTRAARGTTFVFDDSPINPFNESITLRYPLPETVERRQRHFTTARLTGGLIADLPLGWRGTAEATFGWTRANLFRTRREPRSIVLGPPFGPDINPLGDWQEFLRELAATPTRTEIEARTRNRYREQSLRLAGPLVAAPGGDVTLSLLAERRTERVPAFTTTARYTEGSDTFEDERRTAARGSASASFYGELRAPVFASEALVPFLRGLELQLAVRHDRLRTNFDPDPIDLNPGQNLRRSFRGTSFTGGAKVTPWPWLMLRASYATGSQPPTLQELFAREEMDDFAATRDPKRGGNFIGPEGAFLSKFGGNPDLTKADANTLSLGAVLHPEGRRGPRISIDYSRIRKSREPVIVSADFVVDNEDRFPERVGRAPLTDADRALGYTGGRIILLDERAMNGGAVKADALDGRLEWPVALNAGRLRLYGAATWQISNEERQLSGPVVKRLATRLGPLKWRANAGADWSHGATTIGFNVQYFSRYEAGPPGAIETEIHGSRWIKAQAYVDLHASRRFRVRSGGPLEAFTVDFGIVNVFDKAPPREGGYIFGFPGYSRYGDPRRRRFELVLSSEF